jgi:hypothetical protein
MCLGEMCACKTIFYAQIPDSINRLIFLQLHNCAQIRHKPSNCENNFSVNALYLLVVSSSFIPKIIIEQDMHFNSNELCSGVQHLYNI